MAMIGIGKQSAKAVIPDVELRPLSAAARLHGPFLDRARAAPQKIALISSGIEQTYGELDRHSNAIAHWLTDQGLAIEEPVAVLMSKGWEQVPAILGILKAGGAYLPLDPDLPRQRQMQIVGRANVRLVLTRRGEAGGVLAAGHLIHLAAEDAVPVDQPPPARSGGEACAYTIFTSGSTGEPKGVRLSHAGALNTVSDVNRRLHIGPGDRVLAISSLSFDLSVYDIFGMLGAGGTIILPAAEDLQVPERWLWLCETYRVTVWNSAPALFKLAIEAAEAVPDGRPLRTLRAVMLSGDWIPLDLPGRARAMCGAHRFIAMGGATEASIWSVWYEVDRVDPEWKSIPYGRPMTDQSLFILDDDARPVPAGTIGELYIGGRGVMLGYCGDERLSDAALVQTGLDERRLYRTGDLARRRADGIIEFLGRRDSQVKLRGLRIDIQEIETLLKRHAAVRDCAVVVQGCDDAARLCAYVVTERPLDAPILRGHLAALLPAYMIPGHWVAVDRIPLTANGKLDRKALTLEEQAQARGEEYVRAPRNAREQMMADLAHTVLGRPVSLDGGLIALGANSIDIIRLAASLRQAGYDVRTRDLFDASSLAELAAQLAFLG
jgi:amino acid adenylation domain-containing protein